MTLSPDINDDHEAITDDVPAMASAGFALRLLKVICAATSDLSPEIVQGRRLTDRASVTRKLWFYSLNNWMSAKSVAALSGFNPAHISREIAQVFNWAAENAAFEAYLDRFDAFILALPEVLAFSEDMVTEMVLELAADRVARAAQRLERAPPPPPKKPPPIIYPPVADIQRKRAPSQSPRPALRVVGGIEAESRA